MSRGTRFFVPLSVVMTYIYDQFGIKRKLAHLNAVEYLERVKEKAGSDPWPVIEACIKVWEDTNPTAWRSYLYGLQEVRDSRKDKKYASTKDKVTGGYLRYTLDVPEKVLYMVRCIYDSSELPMDRKFFLTFAKKFPQFRVAEKM